MTPLGEAAVAAHEMYRALKEAGFTRGEALELVAKYIAVLAQEGDHQ